MNKQGLSFDAHIQAKVSKAISRMGIIGKAYTYLDNHSFLLLYKALVRPLLEYANQVWATNLNKHKLSIENVQRRATRQLPGFKDLTYEERLRKLNLPTLDHRRDRGDMIETYKILTGKYDSSVSTGLFTLNNTVNDVNTRGNSLKIFKPPADRRPRHQEVLLHSPCGRDVEQAP